jgi:hypothetical protein
MSEESENEKPTLDDALMDPELILFPRFRPGEYPHHAVLRPQWLKSHSKYPCWVHHVGHWYWMTSPLQYAEQAITSPELGLHEAVDESVPLAGEDFFSPENSVPINPPGEIHLIAETAEGSMPLGMFSTVKAAMAAFEEFWLPNRSRILEIPHVYPETIIEASDWRPYVRNLKFPPRDSMREKLEHSLENIRFRRPIIRTRYGSFAIYQPEAVSFYENPEYPGNDILRLSDKNGEHMISIAIEAVLEIDTANVPREPADPESTFEALR